MVVYAKDQTDVHYRTWNGSTWSGEGTITAPAGPSGKARWTTLAADPNSDRVGLAVLTESEDVWLAVWDGDAWNAADKLSATIDTNDRDYANIAIAFENESGEILVTYGTEANAVSYRTWAPGGGWSAEQVGPSLGDKATSMTLDTDPLDNRIMLSVLDEGNDVNYILWDGTSWGTPSEQEIDTGQSNAQPFAFVWDVDTAGDQTAPTLTLPGGTLDYQEGDPATVIDATATVSDPDSANFDTGTLSVDFTAGGTANDRLSIRDQGTDAGLIGVSGSTVSYGGTVIGTFTGGTDGSTPLVVTFNANATPTAVDALAKNITYENVVSDPFTENRSVRFFVTDGDGGTSSAEVIAIDVNLDETGALAVWRENGTTTPEYNVFDGIRFRTEGNSASLGEWEVMQGADAPTRDEAIVLGVESGTRTIRGQMWDGTNWTPLSINDLGTANTDNYQGFDVAYEQTSGDAVIVWNDAGTLKTSTWNGTSWTAPAAVTAYTGAEAKQMSLAASPDSDEMVLIISDTVKDEFALVWDGSTWGNEVALVGSGRQRSHRRERDLRTGQRRCDGCLRQGPDRRALSHLERQYLERRGHDHRSRRTVGQGPLDDAGGRSEQRSCRPGGAHREPGCMAGRVGRQRLERGRQAQRHDRHERP